MNIILLDREEIIGDLVTLRDHRAEHIIKVLRACPNDRVTVGIINGKMGSGIIKELEKRKPYSVELKVILDKIPDRAAPLDIMLALPRPIVFKRIICHLTALGVNHVYVVNAAKVEKSYWDSSVVTEDGWQAFIREGLEQAVDTRLVEFSFHRGFRPFIEEVIPAIKKRYAQMLVAHPDRSHDLARVYKAGNDPVLMAIGPEGGWNEFELEQMRMQGFDSFSLGPRILRVETAVTAVHASITMLRMLKANQLSK